MATDIAPPLPEKSKLRARKISMPDVKTNGAATATIPPLPPLQAASSNVHDNNNNNVAAVPEKKKIKSRFTEHFDHIPPPELLDELAESDFHVPTVRRTQPSSKSTLSKGLRPFLYSSNSSSTLNYASSDIVLSPSASLPTRGGGGNNNNNNNDKRPPLSSSSFWTRSLSSRNLGSQISDDEGSHPLVASSLFASQSEDDAEKGNSSSAKKKSSFFGTAGRKKNNSSGSSSKKEKHSKESSEEEQQQQLVTSKSTTAISNNNKATNVIQSLFSLNRAEVIVTRLENWHHVLKAISGWLEEIAKVSFQNSRCYSQRALPLVKNANGSERDAMATMQTGLEMLTTQLANEQKEFGKRIQHDFLPGLLKLRKDCKEMIRGLKEEPDLVMDELLRRAETTRKSMAALNKCCKAAESAQHTIDDDPWLANLYVLRQLKREVDEENRMRELMVPIQKGTAAFEARAIEHLKQAIEFCYSRLSPSMWEGTGEDSSDSTPPYKLVLGSIMPDYEWDRFLESKKKDLVNPDNPRKDYLRINYPNKLNPIVMTLAKGTLERRAGVRKQFVERYFVLSQCGYFYEFTMNDKVTPERSIYIPDTTIVPSIDISHLAAAAPENLAQGYTFEIHKRGTQMLQRDKTYVYRAQSREELLSWCRLLCEVAARGSKGGPPIKHILAPDQRRPPMPRSMSSSFSFIAADNNTSSRPHNGSSVSIPTMRAMSVASVKHSEKHQHVPVTSNGSQRRGSSSASPTPGTPTSATHAVPTDEAIVQELAISDEPTRQHQAYRNDEHDDECSDDEGRRTRHTSEEPTTPTSSNVTHKLMLLDDPVNKSLDTDDVASILTARPIADDDDNRQQEEKEDEDEVVPARPESRASTHFTDTESSIYFSSNSAEPSPNGSAVSLTAPQPIEQFAIPELENNNAAPQAGAYFYSPKLSSPLTERKES